MRTADWPRISLTVSNSAVLALMSSVSSLPLQPTSATQTHTHGLPASQSAGALIAPRLALTAAHVVFDKVSGAPLTGVGVGPADSADRARARAVWPDRFLPGDCPAGMDAAQLEIDDPGWRPAVVGPVRWGRLTGRSAGVACEAIGFPRVLRDPDGTRESDQISGMINP